MPYMAGWNKGSYFKVYNTSTFITLCVTNWNWESLVSEEAFSTSGTPGKTGRIFKELDGTGTVHGFINSSHYPWAARTGDPTQGPIREGFSGILSLQVGPDVLGTIDVPVTITKLRVTSEHGGLVEYEFEVKYNAFVFYAMAATYSFPNNHGQEETVGELPSGFSTSQGDF